MDVEPDPASAAFVVSTSDAPPGRKLDFWTELTDQFFPLTLSNFAENFDAVLEARGMGSLAAIDVRCSQVDTRRTPPDIARGPMRAYYVFEQTDPDGSAFRTPGCPEGFVHGGDLVLGNADVPFESLTRSRFGHRVWLIPYHLAVGAPLPSAVDGGVLLRAESPLARLLMAYFRELRALGPSLDAACTDDRADVAVRLFALAAGGRATEEPSLEATGLGALALVKQRIERRLTDPLLSPRRVAFDCGISVRKLHALFEPTGITFTAFVVRRRLEIAHSRLADPRHPVGPIADLAFSLGFNSLSAFYRAYHDAYGEAPGDTRARSAGNGLR